jgi:rare lipoprotein A
VLSIAVLGVPLISLRPHSSTSTPVSVRAGQPTAADLAARADRHASRGSRSQAALFAAERGWSSTTSTSTTAPPPPPTAPPTTAKARVRVVTPTTAKPRPTTTTTAPPPPPSSTGQSQEGKASWYDEAPAGTCAHRTIPKGTIVTVINVANGKRTTCKVADRGPYVDGWIIDLAKSTFAEIAPTSSGVINVRIEW